MTPEQVTLVKTSFQKLTPEVDSVGRTFYQRLFAAHPEMRTFFRGDMEDQSRTLMAMIGLMVKTLDLHEKLVPLIRYLGERHAVFGVKPQHYAPFGDALIETLALTLNDEFTPEVRRAWEAAYKFMAENMR